MIHKDIVDNYTIIVNNINMSVQKIDRNKEIIAKKMAGTTYDLLSKEYHLSVSALMGIIQRWKYAKAIEHIEKLENDLIKESR